MGKNLRLLIIVLLTGPWCKAQNNAIFNGGNASGHTNICTPIISFLYVLPIELLYFKAHCEEEKIRLDWGTASEINNQYFMVEWTSNGYEWQEISLVSGAGTSATFNSYESIIKITVDAPYLYFRLKQVDFDGKHTYSNVISVETCTNLSDRIKIYPVPAHDFFTIEWAKINIGTTITLHNSVGELVHQSQAVQENSVTLRPSMPLPLGVYTISLSDQNQITRYAKIILN